jgi:predicted dehydrogenase
MAQRLKVGVVGCGLIAQVMHLHYLQELSDQFEIAALCDLSEEVRNACARRYRVDRVFERWQDLIREPLDGVLILSSGSHAPVAIAAAKAGLHLFIEKPMCFSVAEGRAMIEAAERAGVALMVGYNKRYDPAYRRLVEEAGQLSDIRLAQVTTLESPLEPYVGHYPMHRGAPLAPEVVAVLKDDTQRRIAAAIGDVDPLSRRAYHLVLLDSMVHEFNAVRGVLGEPDQLDYADVREDGLTVVLRFGKTHCVIAWVDLPGSAQYEMNFAFHTPDRRLSLAFPSPFLRSMPTLLTIEGGEIGAARAWRTDEVVSYDESFKLELMHFHECATTGRQPVTSGLDALRDVALCQAVIEAHRARRPQAHPTNVEVGAAMLEA